MLYHVQMDVRPPPDVDPELFERLKAEEKASRRSCNAPGKWRHLWRIAGRYANISVLDVEDHDELHAILSYPAAVSLYGNHCDAAGPASLGYRLNARRANGRRR